MEFSSPSPTDLPRCAEKAYALLSSLEELEQKEVVVRVLAGKIGRGFYSPCCTQTIREVQMHFKPETSQSDCYMVSIELRDAYLHIPIAEGSQKFLRLAVRSGEETFHLQFRALTFGLSSSPASSQ